MIVEVLAGLVTDVCLWERPTFKAILKASQWVFEFPRHWGTIFPTCEESARTPLTKWLFSGAELYFYGSKGPVTHFPIFFYMAIQWNSNPSMTETELKLCFLQLSKLCNSKCSVNALSDPVSWPLSAKKTTSILSYGTCWSLTVGTVTTDPLITFSHPASLLLHSCLAPAVRPHHFWLLIPTFFPCPMLSV